MSHHLFVSALLWILSGAPQPPGDTSDVELHLRRATQELLDAVAPGNADVWRKFLDDRVVHVDENGTVRGKTELLAELKPLPAGLKGSIRVGSFRSVLHGDVAVATHEDHESLDYHGQTIATRFRTTDTWIRTAVGWRLLASQVMAVLDDPPAARVGVERLCAYEGVYDLTERITTRIRCQPSGLVSERTGRGAAIYLPETSDVFFAPGQPRTRRIFQRNPTGAIVGFVDRREGHDITWRKVSNSHR